jgi:beta-glucanase (GH16 family)
MSDRTPTRHTTPRRRHRASALAAAVVVATTLSVAAAPSYAEQSATEVVIDDFETGVAPGGPCPAGGLPLGFCTFNGAGSSVSLSNPTTPPAPELPAIGTPNSVLQIDVDSTSFAGFIHGFTDAAMDAWIPQDWSTREGISFWMYGNGSGTQMFIDILDNRNPGSTGDDAERWTVPFTDDFTGWQLLEFPFTSFTRKEIGNGAPNDGLGLFQMHGYAIGTLGTGGPRTYFIDEVGLYGVAEPPAVSVQLSQQNTFVTEGTTGQVGVKLNRPLGPDDPAQVSIDYATERSNAVPFEEFTPTSGTLTFVNGGPSELFFPVETFDDTKFEGDEQIVIRLTNPVDVERGALFQGSVLIDDDDPFDPDLLDDFEQGAYFWDAQGDAAIETVRVTAGGPDARPEQDAVEHVGVATVPVAIDVEFPGAACPRGNAVVPVHILSSPVFDATAIDHTTVRLGTATEAHVDRRTGEVRRHVDDVNGDGLDDLVFHFRFAETGLSCGAAVWPVTGETYDGHPVSNVGGFDASLVRDFPLGQDWSDTERLDFWYHGAGGGEEITVTLKDNRAPDPGPGGWELAWADEFDDPAGTAPNPANWAHEVGDTTPDGKNGWGNEELQYYTDDPANAATDGHGNLVIALTEADGSQECYYGPCEFESARLITQNRAEFAYGRIESRLLVPDGGFGLWPAFWSLGSDITYNPWPGAGEIDIMEYVSRLPNEIFGTVHGPGYSGGASIGDTYDFGLPVYEAGDDGGFHTFTVEWEPNLITWYVDDIQYHQVTPADLPGPWVFDKPFFLLLNLAVGGNFGGAVDPDISYPQEYLVDYVRVYQGPDTAERFEASFVDNTAGWQRVSIPITDFVRSDDQPAGAPNDGLGLDEVWGYGFDFPNGTASGEARIDLVERVPVPPPTELVVTTLADGGSGSLREALGLIADGGTITFDPALVGESITLTSGPLVIGRSVTVDGGDAPGITVDGGGVDRVLVVDSGAVATVSDLTLRNGYGYQLAGCVLNNGTLTLDHSTVTGCSMTTDAGDFWQGGGGVYNGDGATLNLIDSTVSGNRAGWSGGGVYSYFNTTTNVVRSTISGNVSSDVGGGLRLLGNADIVNSTISGNESTGWYGGALFLTDGVADVVNSTITANTSPSFAPAAVFVGTFGDGSATMNLRSSIIAANRSEGCFLAPFGAGPVTINSLGGNVFSDGTCFSVAGDQQVVDAGLDGLADNGGPTLTHALLSGSPAIDVAVGTCPPTDQRGVVRPQGVACDVGAFEFVS